MDQARVSFLDRRYLFTLGRRFVVLVALMFWQGGFTFYSSVVVPVGQTVLGSHRKQGFITREVTNYLNLTGAVALVPLAWDVLASQARRGQRRWRWLAWLAMAATQGVLFGLHEQLSQLLDPERLSLLDRGAFRTGHRWYLWVSTVQWGAAIVYTLLTLAAWVNEDRFASTPANPASSAEPSASGVA